MKNKFTVAVGALLVVVFGLFLFMFQVRQTEVALVTRFGRAHRHQNEPGAYFKLPWPIEKVHSFDKRIQNVEDALEETFTKDEFSLMVKVYAGWTIADPEVYFPRWGKSSTNEAVQSLLGMIGTAKNAVVGKHPFSDFISTDPKNSRFAEIEKEILAQVQEKARKEYGIDVKFLGIQRLALPDPVTKTVFERMKTERDLVVKKIQSEADTRAGEIRARGERESRETLASARSKADKVLSDAQSKAAESFRELEKDPSLATLLFSLRAIETSISNNTTLILDDRTPPFNLFTSPPDAVKPVKKP